MRKSLALAVATVSALGVGALVPTAANAAGSSNQTVTFTVGTPGLLTIANAVGTTVLSGTTTMSGAIPLTTVTDTRTSAGNWTVSASSSDFTLVGVAVSPASTITASHATLETNTPTVAVPGTATVTDSHDTTTSGTPLALSTTAATLMTAATTNANIVTYNATVKVDTTGAANGLYTGTVTQSVA